MPAGLVDAARRRCPDPPTQRRQARQPPCAQQAGDDPRPTSAGPDRAGGLPQPAAALGRTPATRDDPDGVQQYLAQRCLAPAVSAQRVRQHHRTGAQHDRAEDPARRPGDDHRGDADHECHVGAEPDEVVPGRERLGDDPPGAVPGLEVPGPVLDPAVVEGRVDAVGAGPGRAVAHAGGVPGEPGREITVMAGVLALAGDGPHLVGQARSGRVHGRQIGGRRRDRPRAELVVRPQQHCPFGWEHRLDAGQRALVAGVRVEALAQRGAGLGLRRLESAGVAGQRGAAVAVGPGELRQLARQVVERAGVGGRVVAPHRQVATARGGRAQAPCALVGGRRAPPEPGGESAHCLRVSRSGIGGEAQHLPVAAHPVLPSPRRMTNRRRPGRGWSRAAGAG